MAIGGTSRLGRNEVAQEMVEEREAEEAVTKGKVGIVGEVEEVSGAVGEVEEVSGAVGEMEEVSGAVGEVEEVSGAVGEVEEVSGAVGEVEEVDPHIGSTTTTGLQAISIPDVVLHGKTLIWPYYVTPNVMSNQGLMGCP
ncbi:hypothetical protein NHX12_015791 [Muraenolepis orangiensis]|uniref:Uncharacterized protein n=1 Tax=Muraenolepis orangiensis TaxID=630683 RepID=A0A9Q0D806_9TELE|nr:hypothetical protein NHX12_015791 [Muraenolepis orangiensis]